MKKMILLVTMVLSVLLLAAGCGEEQAEETLQETMEAADNAADNVAETALDEPAAAPLEEPWARVESTNGAYTNLEVPVDWSSIGTQQAFIAEYYDYSSCRIFIANFETGEDLSTLAREPGQGIIKFTLRMPPESDPQVGIYDLTRTGESFTGEAGVMVTGGSTVQFATSSMTDGVLEITSVTDGIVAGTFQLEDNWTVASGAFQAEIR